MKNRKILLLLLLSSVLIFNSCQTTKNTIKFKDRIGHQTHVVSINKNIRPYELNDEAFISDGYYKYYEDDQHLALMGVDISRHDDAIDWKELKEAGIDFVIFRVAYRRYEAGLLVVDENFHDNIKAAMEAGFTNIGAYVFSQARNEQEAIEEAEIVLKEIEGYPITLPVFYDPEFIANDPARSDDVEFAQLTKNAVTFCQKIEEAGFRAGVYANLAWETLVFDLEQLQDYSIWYADYHKVPQTPYDFEFWQYYDKGRLPGLSKICDLNLWIIHKNEVK